MTWRGPETAHVLWYIIPHLDACRAVGLRVAVLQLARESYPPEGKAGEGGRRPVFAPQS